MAQLSYQRLGTLVARFQVAMSRLQQRGVPPRAIHAAGLRFVAWQLRQVCLFDLG